MLPKKGTKSLRLRKDLVAKEMGLLIRDLNLLLIRGNREGLQDLWDNFP